MMSLQFKKGYVLRRDESDTSGYILTRDVFSGELVQTSDFMPFGGAKEPVAGEVVPSWLCEKLGLHS